jgi:uncharacterized SAM-binding protein YcdF (DUF218 family)
LLPLVGGTALLLAWGLSLPHLAVLALAVLAPLAISLIYSTAATAWLSAWLLAQLPPAPAVAANPTAPVAVLVGRGPEVAAVTTRLAAARLLQGQVSAVVVSGDDRSTAERLLRLGVDPSLISGDSCARTTWENATRTAGWLRQHHPGDSLPAVLLITDPWQLPRAAHAFARQGLQVQPLAAEPPSAPPNATAWPCAKPRPPCSTNCRGGWDPGGATGRRAGGPAAPAPAPAPG